MRNARWPMKSSVIGQLNAIGFEKLGQAHMVAAAIGKA
jgi:hypothetical protein